MLIIWMIIAALIQPIAPLSFHARTSTVDLVPFTREYDLVLTEWRGGVPIQLKHSLFQLDYVSASEKPDNVILFKGKTFGEPGQITIDFYTTEGDLVGVPQGSSSVARVDKEQREFTVAARIPALLRGQKGVVQVSFQGAKRAAFLLLIKF
jgi:hypothetical protein